MLRRPTPHHRASARFARFLAVPFLLAAFGAARAQSVAPLPFAVLDGNAAVAPGSTIDYGPFAQTATADPVFRWFTIQNQSGNPLTVSNVVVTPPAGRFVLTGIVPPVTLGPGATQKFNVRFRRNVAGTFTSDVQVYFDGTPAPSLTFHVRGTVVATNSELRLAAEGGDVLPGSVLDYGTHAVTPWADPLFRIYTASNTGTAPLTIHDVAITGGNRFVLAGIPSLPQVVAPGALLDFNVRFRRDVLGVHTHTVSIASDDPESPFVFQVRGEVVPVAPDLEVRSGGVLLGPADAIDFGQLGQTGGAGYALRAISLHNVGGSLLSVTDTVVGGPPAFALAEPFTPVSLASGEQTSLELRFSTAHAGTLVGGLTLVSNDPGGALHVPLRGEIVPAPRIAMRAGGGVELASNDAFAFPDTAVGTANGVTFTLENTGVAPLVVENPDDFLAGDAAFSLIEPLFAPGEPAQIEPGGERDFRIRLSSAAVGSFGAQLSLASNAVDPGGDPFVVSLSGRVGEPVFTVALAPELVAVARGESATAAVSLVPEFEFESPAAIAVNESLLGISLAVDPPSIAPGELAELTVSANAGAPLGVHSFTVRASHGELESFVQRELVVTTAPPEVTSVEPAVLVQGGPLTLTVHGTHLAGVAPVLLPAGDPSRPVPTVLGHTISPSGTQLQLSIDASAPDVEGFFLIALGNDSGAAAGGFRIVPHAGPIVDHYTPSQVGSDGVYLFTVLGENLTDASITPSTPEVVVLSLLEANGDMLSGWLVVPESVNSFDLSVSNGAGPPASVPVFAGPLPESIPLKHTQVLTPLQQASAEEAVTGPGASTLFAQELTHVLDLSAESTGPGKEESGGAGGPPAPQGDLFPEASATWLKSLNCNLEARYKKRFGSWTNVWPLHSNGDVNSDFSHGSTIAAAIAQVIRMGVVIVNLDVDLSSRFSFDPCHFSGVSFCMQGSISWEITGFAGHQTWVSCCFNNVWACPVFRSEFTGALSFLNYRTGSNGGCSDVFPPDPVGNEKGHHFTDVLVQSCGPDTVSVDYAGYTYSGRYFEGPLRLAIVEPEDCAPVDCGSSLVDVVVRSFIPFDYGLPMIPIPVAGPDLLWWMWGAGDSRNGCETGGTFRTQEVYRIDTTTGEVVFWDGDASTTTYFLDPGGPGTTPPPSPENASFSFTLGNHESGLNESTPQVFWTTPPDGAPIVERIELAIEGEGRTGSVHVPTHVPIGPLLVEIPFPAINYCVDLTLHPSSNLYEISGRHDRYPAYEIYINGGLAYCSLPQIPAVNHLSLLAGECTVPFSASGVVHGAQGN